MMAAPADHKIFLTGVPGAGKTTVVRRTAERLRKRGLRLWGFVTEEVSEDASRTGFQIITMEGARVPFAHVLMKRGPRVGPYRVDVTAFEGLALPSLDRPRLRNGQIAERSVGLIDEVGRMECLSRAFAERVRALLEEPGCLLFTVTQSGPGLIEEVRRRAGDDLIAVTPANREILPDILAETFWRYLKP